MSKYFDKKNSPDNFEGIYTLNNHQPVLLEYKSDCLQVIKKQLRIICPYGFSIVYFNPLCKVFHKKPIGSFAFKFTAFIELPETSPIGCSLFILNT